MNQMSGMTTFSSNEFDGLMANTILVTLDLLNDLILQINLIEMSGQEKEYFLNRQLSELTTDISRFVEVTTLLSRLILNRKKVTIPEIKNSHIHLLSVMKGISQARQKMDRMVLEDLIKYELKDNLTQWKIDFIPQTKRLLNT
jgi:ABC-type ATPase with predicted acetyltransferase domain